MSFFQRLRESLKVPKRFSVSELLTGKSALVTGAAQGIGAAIASAMASEGAKVLTLDRQEGQCDYTVDLSDLQTVRAFVNSMSIVPDILVNGAGVCLTRAFFDVDLHGFEAALHVNVLAPFLLSQSIARGLVTEKRAGVIVNIASNSGFMPKLEQLDYGASKAALISVTRSMAASLGPHGIRVNAIAPGVIDTPLTQSIAKQRSEIRGVPPEETLRPVLENLPLRRMGAPSEVAQLAVFLASDKASYITGQTYVVDGGQWMR